jgi:hypothetical protein
MFLPETGSGGGDTADQRRDTAFRAASLVVETAALPQQQTLSPAGAALPQQSTLSAESAALPQQPGSAAGAALSAESAALSQQQTLSPAESAALPQQPELPALWRRSQLPPLTV